MKKNLLLLCATLFATTLSAQEHYSRPIAVEMGTGLTFGASKLCCSGLENTAVGGTWFVEARYNFNQIPVDVGFHTGATVFGRTISAFSSKAIFLSGNFMAVADYNFRLRNPACVVFTGLGAGMAAFRHSAQTTYYSDGSYSDLGQSVSVCLMPRAGIELWQRLRLTLSYLIEEPANSHLSLTVGIVIGCGRK